MFDEKAPKEVWALFNASAVSEIDRIVLGSTFDDVVVMREDIPRLIDAFRKFEGDTSLPEQADLIQKLLETDGDFQAIAWNQTSVISDAWKSDESILDEYGDEVYPPYNLNKGDEHWNLFENV